MSASDKHLPTMNPGSSVEAGTWASGTGMVDVLENLARQHCHTARVASDYNGQVAGTLVTDSGGISVNADALLELAAAKPPRFRVVAIGGRMVVGYWPEHDPNSEVTQMRSP